MTEKLGNYDYVADLPLHEITINYGTTGLIDRFSYEVSKLPEDAQQKINQAFLSAAEWHKDQMRTNGPYIDHILRVTLRVLHHYEVDDPDILIAALLHDSIEDQSDKIVGHKGATPEAALAVIEERYGPRVVNILSALTNPPGDITREEYDAHVRKALIDVPDAIPVKLSDFTDNAVGIFWTEGEAKKAKLAEKYLPLVEFYRSLVTDNLYHFSDGVKQEMLKKLADAELRMQDILKASRARAQSAGDIATGPRQP